MRSEPLGDCGGARPSPTSGGGRIAGPGCGSKGEGGRKDCGERGVESEDVYGTAMTQAVWWKPLPPGAPGPGGLRGPRGLPCRSVGMEGVGGPASGCRPPGGGEERSLPWMPRRLRDQAFDKGAIGLGAPSQGQPGWPQVGSSLPASCLAGPRPDRRKGDLGQGVSRPPERRRAPRGGHRGELSRPSRRP